MKDRRPVDELSIAELGAHFVEKITLALDRAAAFVDVKLPDAPHNFLDRLGGTTEIE